MFHAPARIFDGLASQTGRQLAKTPSTSPSRYEFPSVAVFEKHTASFHSDIAQGFLQAMVLYLA